LTKAVIKWLIDSTNEAKTYANVRALIEQLSTSVQAAILQGVSLDVSTDCREMLFHFIINEAVVGRPWLAIGMMFGFWESLDRDLTDLAIALNRRLPDGSVPRFFYLVVKEHGPTRFHKNIVM